MHKLIWKPYERRPGVWLRASVPDVYMTATQLEDHLIEIGEWCRENDCGSRQSFDMWQFKNHEQVTAFLLRWA
jgi:hypothetical protein